VSVPGLSKFPDLEAQFSEKMAALRRKPGCKACEQRKLINRYRALVEKRLKRDK
jgi:hypothetical protein